MVVIAGGERVCVCGGGAGGGGAGGAGGGGIAIRADKVLFWKFTSFTPYGE